MIRPYAEGTSVPADKSRSEIERTLKRYGADAFSYGFDGAQAAIMFRAKGRMVRFVLPIPPAADFATTSTGYRRTNAERDSALEREIRRLWRALAMMVKAKLEAVQSGLVEFEEEFMANVVLPDGTTFGQWAGPQIAEVYATGDMPALLPGVKALGVGR